MLTPPTLSECVDDALISMKATSLHITRFIYWLQFQQHIALMHVLYHVFFSQKKYQESKVLCCLSTNVLDIFSFRKQTHSVIVWF